jgi:hypothetical protein
VSVGRRFRAPPIWCGGLASAAGDPAGLGDGDPADDCLRSVRGSALAACNWTGQLTWWTWWSLPAAQELATWAETNDRWRVSGQLANGQVSDVNSGQTKGDLTPRPSHDTVRCVGNRSR